MEVCEAYEELCCCAAIPGGLPLLGNLLQLTEKKPHRTFTTWAHEHGPIYTIQVGQVFQVVINNSDIAKEVLCMADTTHCGPYAHLSSVFPTPGNMHFTAWLSH